MYDAVYLFANALDSFLKDETLEQESLHCDDKDKIFQDGNSLLTNYIKTVVRYFYNIIKFRKSARLLVIR